MTKEEPSPEHSPEREGSSWPTGTRPVYSQLFTCCPATDNHGEWTRGSKKEPSFLFREEGRANQTMLKAVTTDGRHC